MLLMTQGMKPRVQNDQQKCIFNRPVQFEKNECEQDARETGCFCFCSVDHSQEQNFVTQCNLGEKLLLPKTCVDDN